MVIFVTGATGLLGRKFVLSRLELGDRVVLLSRNAEKATSLFAADVNPNVQIIDGDPTQPGDWQRWVDDCDVIVNFAGASIADTRWSAEYKETIVNSRLDSTRNLVDAIEASAVKPKLLVSTSAIGYYGRTGSTETDESAEAPIAGADFLADLCVRWEGQANRAKDSGVRVVLLRIGIVLDETGGALLELIKPFKFFLGGPLGSGKQYMSWIHSRDVAGMINNAISDSKVEGPVNCVSPVPVKNRDFMRAIGDVLGRPTWLRVPEFVLKIAVGEMSKYIMTSQRIIPAKANEHGFHFVYPELESALHSLLSDTDDYEEELESETQEESHGQFLTLTMDDPAHISSRSSSALEATQSNRTRLQKPETKIRIVAIDVDGTMLRSDGRLPKGVIDACRAAGRSDCLVIPATARPPRSMKSILQTLGHTGPTINYNGAVIWNPHERTAQYHESLDPSLVREIIDDARAVLSDVVVSVEILDKWYTDRVDNTLETETSRFFDPDYVGSFDSFLNQPITKLMLLAHPTALQPVLEMVKEHYWSTRRVAVFITDPHIIQIAHALVDKGIALQRVAKRMGVVREEVMAIGDGPNDAGMIEWCGFGVAVENACDSARDLADAIVPSNNDLGVAKAIQRYILSSD